MPPPELLCNFIELQSWELSSEPVHSRAHNRSPYTISLAYERGDYELIAENLDMLVGLQCTF